MTSSPDREAMLDELDRKVREARLRHWQTKGFVYFIQSGGFVKIGYTDNPHKRFKAFKTTNPVKCRLIGILRGAKKRETEIQNMFWANRHQSEWFLLDAYVRAEIRKLCGPNWKSVIPKKPKGGICSHWGPAEGIEI